MLMVSSWPILLLMEASLWRKAAQASLHTCNCLESLALRKESLLDNLFAASFVVDMSDIEMHSFCLLTSMEPIHIANCSLLYLHSNDMNSLKSLFLKKKWEKKSEVKIFMVIKKATNIGDQSIEQGAYSIRQQDNGHLMEHNSHTQTASISYTDSRVFCIQLRNDEWLSGCRAELGRHEHQTYNSVHLPAMKEALTFKQEET